MDIKMPQLGESVTEGSINQWLVKPGEHVKQYQSIAEVVSDKVTAEIPSPADGQILTLDAAEGLPIEVGVRIATMEIAQSASQPLTQSATQSDTHPSTRPETQPATELVVDSPKGATSPALPRMEGSGGRFSPAVLRLAGEHGVDLRVIKGTGLGGRITRKDVEGFIAQGPEAGAPAASEATGPHPLSPTSARSVELAGAPAAQEAAGDQTIPVDAVRRHIAQKMLQSKREAPHAWTMMQADVTGLTEIKRTAGEAFKRREGISLSYMPFFIKAVVESLREFPMLNSQWAGEQIILHGDINISIAVATETSLAVPVIHNADRLSITGLAHAVTDLAQRARDGTLTIADITGGTFTVNNTGSFGSVMSAPIINYPQAAILSFEAIVKMPIVLPGDAIAIRSMMNICMSLDHRVLDGLVCGRFLQAVKARLERFALDTVSLS